MKIDILKGLRAQANRCRQLARGLTDRDDRLTMNEYADVLAQQALDEEAGAPDAKGPHRSS